MKTSRFFLVAALLCLASLPALAQVNDTYVIPASANAGGASSSHWRTRISLFNPQLEYPLVVRIVFLPTGGATHESDMIEVELPENSVTWSDNLLADAFGITSGTGSLLIAAFAEDNPGVPDDVLSRGFLVSSDTYNTSSTGTFGQTIPGEWVGLLDYESDQISSVAHGITHRGTWRTNVGAVNLGRCNATLLVSVYDADGNQLLNQASMQLPPFGHLQMPLPVFVEKGSVEFFVDDPCAEDDDRYAVVFPYTSMIDSRTNDPSYQTPKLLASPGVLYAKGQKVDPHALGKKLTSAEARRVTAAANDRGRARLTRTSAGWQITR